MSKKKDISFNFSDQSNVDVEALQKEIDEQIINKDNTLCDKDILDQMTYQLHVEKRMKKREKKKALVERAEEIVSEVQTLIDERTKGESHTLMSEEERDEYLRTLNNASLELSRKIKDVTIYYIALKGKVDRLEVQNREKRDVDEEIIELVTQMKSYRRYNSLSEVDFGEVVRRVIVEIDMRKRPEKKIEERKIFTKSFLGNLFMLLLIVGGLMGGYLYKSNQLSLSDNMKEKYE
jgi:hypothetical protein